MTDLEPFARYLRYERGLTESTIKVYRRYVKDFLKYIGHDPETATGKEVRAWILERGGSASTVTSRLASTRAYFKFLGPVDPTQEVSRPKHRHSLPHPIDEVEEKISKLPDGYRQVAIFLLETGLRISEACSISISPPAPDILRITGKGEKERLVLLQPRAQEALNELGGSIVVPGRGKRQIQRHFQVAGFRAHGLRHTFGTQLAEAGSDLGEIQSLMGHSSPATTRGYAEYSTDRLRAALDRKTEKSGRGA